MHEKILFIHGLKTFIKSLEQTSKIQRQKHLKLVFDAGAAEKNHVPLHEIAGVLDLNRNVNMNRELFKVQARGWSQCSTPRYDRNFYRRRGKSE